MPGTITPAVRKRSAALRAKRCGNSTCTPRRLPAITPARSATSVAAAESSDLAAGLWQLIREGKQRAPQPHDREVMKDAVDLAHASQPYHQTAHAYAGEF